MQTISIGNQSFSSIREKSCFYIDKTDFIREWWESDDVVTLITRPRRFGKTLNMDMLNCFFSTKFANRSDLFEGLSVWEDENYRSLQGTYPVLFLSFAAVKTRGFANARKQICMLLAGLYEEHRYLLNTDLLSDNEKAAYTSVTGTMDDAAAAFSLQKLMEYMNRYYGKNVIMIMDEYDTPMQEAYIGGYWEEMAALIRSLFNATFKTNPFLERGIMTGITRVSKESIFSDLNNLEVVTTTSNKYAASFGFTEDEVFQALDVFGLSDKKNDVKNWYDGFTIGAMSDIYNPWSIINFLDGKKLKPYWANTSSNSLAGDLIRRGNRNIKIQFEDLLQQRSIYSVIDEEMVFNQLDASDEGAVWSLLFASGYLKAVEIQGDIYELELTNYEVRKMFERMVSGWFGKNSADYNDFIKALLRADLEEMNAYMEQVAESVFSSFDSGVKPSAKAPERFYHGFVLGLLVDLRGRYEVLSNRESGFGRYDVMLKPLNEADNGIILEFKVYNPKKEKNLGETVQNALQQIDDKKYELTLLEQGIGRERIRKYGFAFRGKEVLIG